MVDCRYIHLTKKEKAIIKFVVQGFTNAEIARVFGCTESCIKIHVSNILSKFEVKNRAQLGYVIGVNNLV